MALLLVYYDDKRGTMSTQKDSKLNTLFKKWPYSTIFSNSYLVSQGYSLDLIKRYRRSGWLISVGQGAVAKPGDDLDWMSGLYAIQHQLEAPIHAGGKTALQLQGVAHFVPSGKGHPIYLVGSKGTKLPTWFKQYPWGVKLEFGTPKLFTKEEPLALSEYKKSAYSIQISSKELAIFEVLESVPQTQSYEEAFLLMENLQTLRPKLVQSLLEKCTSYKVKRLFLHLAEKVGHSWVKKLDLKKVDLGKGKRSIGDGGVYDSKYEISVPKIYQGGELK